uniref:hypothetical protein n=1 Tax=Actinoplanes teichomyceticus TaxID=1867 RepID=UPI001940A31D|nr:hypothetical protein [Actinoplanes teichomyceticus]
MIDSLAGRFARVEPRRAAAGCVDGLPANLAITTCWQVAERAGHARPDVEGRLMANKPGKRRFGNVRKLSSGRWQARYLGLDV